MSYFVNFLSENEGAKVWFKFKEDSANFKAYIIKKVENDCIFLQGEFESETILIPIDNICYIKMNYDY